MFLPFVLYCQVIVEFIGDRFVKYTGQHLAEQTGNNEYQDNNENGGRYINEKAAGRYERNAETVDAHPVEAAHIFFDETVVPDNGKKHFAQFMNDQNGENTRQEQDNEQRVKIISEVGIVFSVKFDGKRKGGGNENTGKVHQVE